jgi:hypothetical protein
MFPAQTTLFIMLNYSSYLREGLSLRDINLSN